MLEEAGNRSRSVEVPQSGVRRLKEGPPPRSVDSGKGVSVLLGPFGFDIRCHV